MQQVLLQRDVHAFSFLWAETDDRAPLLRTFDVDALHQHRFRTQRLGHRLLFEGLGEVGLLHRGFVFEREHSLRDIQ